MPTIAIDSLDSPIAAALAARDDVALIGVGASAPPDTDDACVVITACGAGRDADGSGCGPADLAAARRMLDRFGAAPPASVVVLSSPLAADRAMHSRVGRSRRALEALVESWAAERGTHCTVVRPGLVVDPSPRGRRWLRRSVWNPSFAVDGIDPRRRFVHIDDLAARIVAHATRPAVQVDECADAGVTTAGRQRELVGRLVQPRLTPRGARRLVAVAASIGWMTTDRDVFDDSLVDLVGPDEPVPGDPSSAPTAASDLAWCDGSDEAWWSSKNAHQRQMAALSVGAVGSGLLAFGVAALLRRLSDPSAG